MDNTELHYVSYDLDEIWISMMEAYVKAGGEVLFPGDEKDMLLRSVQAVVAQAFAGVDNALRMGTLRYAVRDYLDLLGQTRGCPRIEAVAATAAVSMELRAGQGETLSAGARLTQDGQVFFQTTEDVAFSGSAGAVSVPIVCETAGEAGNCLTVGMTMQLVEPHPLVGTIAVTARAAGGLEAEGDDDYRERIRQFGLASSTAGPKLLYESKARAVSTQVLDAEALNGGAGVVNVYILPEAGADAAALIQAVTAALSADDVRPLTDTVNVYASPAKEYALDVGCTCEAGQYSADAIAAAVAEYIAWQNEVIGRAFNPDRLMALLYQAGCTRVVFNAGSEFDGGAAEYTEIGSNEHCAGTVTTVVSYA